MRIYYTYAYLRTDGTPYYIGKGKGNRAYVRNKKDCKPPRDRSRILILKSGLTELEALRHEVYMIFVFGRKNIDTGILRNLTDGGEGSSGSVRSEAFKQRLRDRKLTPEHKQKISKSKTGKPRSQETKEKLKAHMAGKYVGATNPNSKRVEVTHPDGSVVIFPYVKAAAEALDCHPSTLKKMGKKGRSPSWGKFKGFLVKYLPT